jgi:hypothetical protein
MSLSIVRDAKQTTAVTVECDPHVVAQRVVEVIDRLALSWRKGYESYQRGGVESQWRSGQMSQSEFAIGLLLGVKTSVVHDALMESKGHL